MDFEYEKQHCMAFFCHIFQQLSMVLGEKGGWLLYLSCVRCWTAHIPRERREIITGPDVRCLLEIYTWVLF